MVIPTAVKLNETVSVVSYDGTQKVKELAEVNVRMGVSERVALVSMEELGRRALIAFPLQNEEEEEFIVKCVRKTEESM